MSAIKYKIGFTIDAETLFTLMSKLLPIDNVKIDEMVERTPDPNVERISKVERLVAAGRIAQPRAHGAYRKKPSRPMDLTKGVNKIIMDILANGPHSANDMRDAMEATGYSPNSIGSRLQNLEKNGVVKRAGQGKWRRVEEGAQP